MRSKDWGPLDVHFDESLDRRINDFYGSQNERRGKMIVYSKDYKGPGFGFLTKAREFDKWTHFAGSATLFVVILLICRATGIVRDWSTPGGAKAILTAAFAVAWGGVALELIQGLQAEDAAKDSRVELFRDADGFSFLDLAANLAGIGVALILVWGMR